jgi:hypothetical protein
LPDNNYAEPLFLFRLDMISAICPLAIVHLSGCDGAGEVLSLFDSKQRLLTFLNHIGQMQFTASIIRDDLAYSGWIRWEVQLDSSPSVYGDEDWGWIGELEVRFGGQSYSICGGNSEELSESLLEDTFPLRWHGYSPHSPDEMQFAVRLRFQPSADDAPLYIQGTSQQPGVVLLSEAEESQFRHPPFEMMSLGQDVFSDIPSFRPPTGKASCFVSGLGYLVRSEEGVWEHHGLDQKVELLPDWPIHLKAGMLVHPRYALCTGIGPAGDSLFLIETETWTLRWQASCAVDYYPWNLVAYHENLVSFPLSTGIQGFLDLSTGVFSETRIVHNETLLHSVDIWRGGKSMLTGGTSARLYDKDGAFLMEYILPEERETWISRGGKAVFFRTESIFISGDQSISKLQWFDLREMTCGEEYLPAMGGDVAAISVGGSRILLVGSRLIDLDLDTGLILRAGSGESSPFPFYAALSSEHLDLYFPRYLGPFRRRILL